MAIWLCKCGMVHTRKEKECKKCHLKKKQTVFLGMTMPSSGGMVVVAPTEAVVKYDEV